jgi:predicted nuclease of predicted toxin-antitoxin system
VSEIRYYTDEHISKAVIRGLRQRGINVLTTPDAGNAGLDDEEHLAFASAEGRVVVTQDDDFLKLAAAGESHAGIVFARQQISIGEFIQGLMLIAQVMQAEEMVDNIEFL